MAFPVPLPFKDAAPWRVDLYGFAEEVVLAPVFVWSAVENGCGSLTRPDVPDVPDERCVLATPLSAHAVTTVVLMAAHIAVNDNASAPKRVDIGICGLSVDPYLSRLSRTHHPPIRSIRVCCSLAFTQLLLENADRFSSKHST